MERFRFPKGEHLRKSSDISAVFKRGKKAGCNGARLFYRERKSDGRSNGRSNACGGNRIAFVFSRKFGCAVERNRARRLGREAYRLLRASLKRKNGLDMVLLVYPDAKSDGETVEKATLDTRLAQLKQLFRAARLV